MQRYARVYRPFGKLAADVEPFANRFRCSYCRARRKVCSAARLRNDTSTRLALL